MVPLVILHHSKVGETGEMKALFDEKPSDDEDVRPHYWFILMLSFGERSGYVYDRSGLHIPDPEKFMYSVELWKFRGAGLKSVETKVSKTDFNEALKAFKELQDSILKQGFNILSY